MADKRADQLKEITERLEQGVKDIFTSEMYTKYLLTMSKFHNYSFNNTLLIAMQRPDATLVAGYNAWKNKFNRYVKKGEKGIQIIAPAPVKEREEREKIDKDTGLTVLNESGEPEIEVVERVIPRFRVTTVFDYAQTDGEPLPTLEVNELTARVKDYTLLKEAIEQVSPMPIRFGEIEGNAKGYYSHMDKEICVRADMGESQTIKTMIHEVAHAMLHDSDQMKQRGEEKDQLTKETEAESIAFTVCSALGIDTSDYSFPYVASWASGKELKELKDSMDTIRLTAADFLEKLETAVAERSVERMTAMEYAEKLIADKERDKTVFDNSQRNLIVNFAYKLDDRAATEELANNLAAAVAAENTEEINRLMWEAEEKIENLPDGMIGLSEMHEYGYLDEQLQEIEIFDKPGLFSNSRLRDEDVPDGLYRYDLRGSDYDPGQPILVEKTVIVNHAASVLMAEELDLGTGGRLELGEEGLNFTGGLLTVREFMEEQEHKKDGLIHGDSDQIAVEGHVGTWYAIDETEVGGEKFFLLEHEEYGDEAACVAVNEQGKLVAEDLWNGFDEDFQDAVKEYFAEKNPTSQKEEQAVPVAEESRTDNSDVPVYYESFAYAAENGEVDLYRISRQLNEDCRNAIEEAIADNFDGMHLADDATKSVVEQFGMERMGYILAYTLNYNNHDGRYSHSNKEWADTTCKGERGNNIRPDWIVRSHPAVLNGFVDMYRKELAAEQQRKPEKPFVQQFYVVTDLQTNPMKIEKFGNLDDAMSCYQQVPNFHLKALGVEKTPDPLPGSLDIVQCKNGIDTIVEDYKKVPGWDNPYIQNHVVALVAEALKVQDVAVAYEINDGYFHIQTSEDGYDYTLYSKDFTVMDGGIVETDEYRPVQEVMEEVLAEHGHSVSECGVISAEYLQEQSYRAETQRAEAMKEKLAAEKPAPEASISFYVAECAEFPVMGEFHDNLTLEQALEVYDKIPAERMKGTKSIGFSLEDGSIYSGMFDLMVGGEVQAEIVNHIQHYRESPLVQKAISDMKTLLEKRQASKELEERPSTRQSVREALKNRKKAQEQQSNQEQEKLKKAKKKGEMEL